MGEKRFIACDKWADSEGNIFKFVVIDMKILGDKQFVLRCNHWSQAQDICNRLNDTLDELREENEQLKKRNKFLEEFDGRAKTVANLKEENEQLKQENNFLKQIREAFQIDVKNSRNGQS